MEDEATFSQSNSSKSAMQSSVNRSLLWSRRITAFLLLKMDVFCSKLLSNGKVVGIEDQC